MQAAPVPIQKDIVLIGAGNAHISFVRMFGMSPTPSVAVTLVCDVPAVPYSAMVPGHIGGEYKRDDVVIDLVRLCAVSGVRLIAERAASIDLKKRQVGFEKRPAVRFDVACLGVGSRPAVPKEMEGLPHSWPMRPLGRTLERLDEVEAALKAGKPFHLALVGGGASGCELALAIRKRFKPHPTFRMTLVHGHAAVLPEFSVKAAKIMTVALREAGIDLRLGERVTGGDATGIVLGGSERLACDAVLWATNAAAPALVRESGLPVDAEGFLEVHDTLQCTADRSVFGTGDCISIVTRRELAKNGVYAVREGKVLFDNVFRFLREQPLGPFKPQRFCRNILNTSDGQAIYTYGPLAWKSAKARRLKDEIDREWMERFSVFEGMARSASHAEDGSDGMRCGGCGSKVPAAVLSSVLRGLDVGEDPRILMGVAAGEDAAVHRPPEGKVVEVQTVDSFRSFVGDPYLFGRIAAVHAVSDIHAMNARPFSALAIATLPFARGPVQEGLLRDLLTGAVKSLREMGVVLTGGHTTEGPEMVLGFSVTGYGDEATLFRKGGLRAGDALVLTKPVGTGAIMAAWMRGQCRAPWYEAVTAGMVQDNAAAAAALARAGCRACTDVTGFGLGGHLLEMLDASGVSARLEPKAVPLYPGFEEVVAKGILSTLHPDNARLATRVQGSASPPAWLFDPQTSGGLLAGVERARVAEVVRALAEAGYARAAVIGEVVEGKPPVVHLPA